jgi:hypothetical protein
MGGVPFLLADVCKQTPLTNPLFLFLDENEPTFSAQLAGSSAVTGLPPTKRPARRVWRA